MNLILLSYKYWICIEYCKDQIWILSPKGGWTTAQRAQNNKFVENGLEKLGLNESDKHLSGSGW